MPGAEAPGAGGRAMLGAAFKLALGTAGGQAAVVLAGPLVSRMFSKADIATALTLATLLTWLAPAACLRYDAAVQAAPDDNEAGGVALAGMFSCLALASLVLLAAVLGGRVAAEALQNPGVAQYLPWLALAVGGQGAYQASNALAIRLRLYELSAKTRLVQGWATALGQVGAGLAGLGAAGLVGADILGRCLGSGRLLAAVSRSPGALLGPPRWARARTAAAKYREFPVYGTPAALVHAGLAAAPLTLSGSYGPEAWAAFGLGVRFVWAPAALLGQALAQAFTGEAGRVARDKDGQLEATTRWAVRRLALLGVVPFGLLALAGHWLVPWVFGAHWGLAGRLVQIQSFAWYVQFVVGPILPLLAIRQRMRQQLVLDSLGLGALVAVLLAAPRAGWPLEATVAAQSAVLVLTYSMLGAASWRAAQPSSSR